MEAFGAALAALDVQRKKTLSLRIFPKKGYLFYIPK